MPAKVWTVFPGWRKEQRSRRARRRTYRADERGEEDTSGIHVARYQNPNPPTLSTSLVQPAGTKHPPESLTFLRTRHVGVGVMWPFDKPTNEDLQRRIDVLEDRLYDVNSRYSELSSDVRSLEADLDDVQEQQSELIASVNRVASQDIPDRKVPKKVGEVYTLENDAVAYKTTEHEVATLVLPKGTQVVYARKTDWNTNRNKLRADQAIVARLEHLRHARYRDNRGFGVSPSEDQFRAVKDPSGCDPDFTYTVGEVVTPDNGFDTDTEQYCAGGIHFYRTLGEAV